MEITSQKRFLAALGMRPLCLLSVHGFQLRAAGLGTDTWVDCLCSIQNMLVLVDRLPRTLPLLSSKADSNDACRHLHVALPDSPQGWVGPVEIAPVA